MILTRRSPLLVLRLLVTSLLDKDLAASDWIVDIAFSR